MRIRERIGTAAAAAFLVALFAIPASAELANAQLKDGSGKVLGDADLAQTQNGVLIKLQLKGIPSGEHAFHIHAVGKCEPPFDSAGPHFNPGGHKHGMLSGPGHAGDMPNLHVPQSGDLSVEVLNTAVTLEKGKPNSLLDNDGSSLVIHAQADDYKTDPTGNAGGRIGCGVIQPSGAVGSSGGTAAPASR
ncbi:MAG: superoxide dismutase family protein [Xanthobacteraceae bacterium]|nr:superoxide dismutase family protein [Xanthobacteraceae bacterium]